MNLQRKMTWLGICAFALALLLGVASPYPAWSDCGGDANAPDFSANDDILNGRRSLSEKADLIATFPDTQQMTYAYTDEDGNSPDQITSMARELSTPTTGSGLETLFKARGARLADIGKDLLVMLTPNADTDGNPIDGQHALSVRGNFGTIKTIYQANTTDYTYVQMTVADFDRDGYDDILWMGLGGNMGVASAEDTSNDFRGKLLKESVAQLNGKRPIAAPTVGDFDNDDNLDVAWLSDDGNPEGRLTLNFATVCGGNLATGTCQGKNAFDIVLSDNSTTLSAVASSYCSSKLLGSLAAGNYNSDDAGAELAVAFCYKDNNKGKINLVYYDFPSGVKPEWKASSTIHVYSKRVDSLYVRAAALDFFDDEQQVVLGVSGKNNDNYKLFVDLYRLANASGANPTIALLGEGSDKHGNSGNEYRASIAGLAVGSFNEDTTDATSYNPSIAWLRVRHNVNKSPENIYRIEIFGLEEDSFDLTDSDPVPVDIKMSYQTKRINWDTKWNLYDNADLLWPADLQGRSVRLGTPAIVRVEGQKQPHIILGMPPMHADFVTPDTQSGSPRTLINLTAVPTSYNAEYALETTDSNQSSTTNSTSWSWAYTESVSATAKGFGGAVVGKTSNTGSEAYSNYVSKEYDSYQSVNYNASSTTTFSDVLWYQSFAQSLYYYPIIGQCACPADDTDCTEADANACTGSSQPANVVYSGPQEVCTQRIEGSTIEWYQPLTEPGQVFSYPSTLAMLEEQVPGLDLLTDTVGYFTDNSASTTSVTWKQSSGESTTTGSTKNYSFDTKNSVTLGTPDLLTKGVSGANVTLGFEFSTSTSIANQDVSSTTLGSSTGVSIIKPATFKDAYAYQYSVLPYIFGQALPQGTVDTKDACDDPTSCLASTGTLRLAYAVDPTDSDAGKWWSTSDYKDAIDIALNHPRRYDVVYNSRCSSLNCVPTGSSGGISQSNCLQFNTSTDVPGKTWTSNFWAMRGLSVQVGSQNGPQRISAVAGEEVYLTAIVHNYSLKDMDQNDTLHVAFYRQPWDSTKNEPYSPTSVDSNGDLVILPPLPSVLIDEVTTDTNGDPLWLPGFNEDTPNWVEATTSFDTTGLDVDGIDQVFWVVTWVTDSEGKLVSEVPGHGLSALPSSLDTLDFVTDLVPIMDTASWTEYDNAAGGSTSCTLSAISDEPFSNNAGMYKQAFTINSPTTATALESALLSSAPSDAQADGDTGSAASAELAIPSDFFIIKGFAMKPSVVLGNEPTIAQAAILHNGTDDGGAISVDLLEQDPSDDTRMILRDEEILGRVRPGGLVNLFRVSFRSRQDCGEHELTLNAGPGTKHETSASAPLTIACAATALKGISGNLKTSGTVKGPGTLHISAQLGYAGEDFELEDMDLQNATLTIYDLARDYVLDLFRSDDLITLPFPLSLTPLEPHGRGKGKGNKGKGQVTFVAQGGGIIAEATLSITEKGTEALLTLDVSGKNVINPRFCGKGLDLMNIDLDPSLLLDLLDGGTSKQLLSGKGTSSDMDLDTRLVLDDGEHEPLLIRLGGTWQCKTRRNGSTMLVRSGRATQVRRMK